MFSLLILVRPTCVSMSLFLAPDAEIEDSWEKAVEWLVSYFNTEIDDGALSGKVVMVLLPLWLAMLGYIIWALLIKLENQTSSF